MSVRTTRPRIYCAGAFSGPDIIAIRSNVRRGLTMAVRVLKAGFAPFAPWLDEQLSNFAEISIDEYYAYSLAWLECADAVLVVPVGAATSKGTQAELKFAEERGIPIFWSLRELQYWARQQPAWRQSALPPGDAPTEMHGGLPVRSSHSGDQ